MFTNGSQMHRKMCMDEQVSVHSLFTTLLFGFNSFLKKIKGKNQINIKRP